MSTENATIRAPLSKHLFLSEQTYRKFFGHHAQYDGYTIVFDKYSPFGFYTVVNERCEVSSGWKDTYVRAKIKHEQ